MRPSQKPRVNAPTTTPRRTASPACSPTWPPSAPTRSNPPTTCQHSPRSPPPPHYNGAPSNYSPSPTASATCSQTHTPKDHKTPGQHPNPSTQQGNFGLGGQPERFHA